MLIIVFLRVLIPTPTCQSEPNKNADREESSPLQLPRVVNRPRLFSAVCLRLRVRMCATQLLAMLRFKIPPPSQMAGFERAGHATCERFQRELTK